MIVSRNQIDQYVLAVTVICPNYFSPGNAHLSGRRLAPPNHMLPEEKKVAHCILVHRASLFLGCGNAFNDVSQIKLLVARELWDSQLSKVLVERRSQLFSDSLWLIVIKNICIRRSGLLFRCVGKVLCSLAITGAAIALCYLLFDVEVAGSHSHKTIYVVACNKEFQGLVKSDDNTLHLH